MVSLEPSPRYLCAIAFSFPPPLPGEDEVNEAVDTLESHLDRHRPKVQAIRGRVRRVQVAEDCADH